MAFTGVSIRNYARLVRGNANFRRLWLAQIVSKNGDWFYTLAIYSLLLDLTGKASSVALALVLQVLPHTLLGPVAGMVNDRFSRRKVMIVTDLLRMVIVACMLLVRSRGFVWVIYPLLFLETVRVAFFAPARNAVIPNVVDAQEVIVANTLSSATWSFDLAIGSMLGGIVAAWLGRDAVFVINSLSFGASALLISRMTLVEAHADAANQNAEDRVAGWSSIRAGFHYIVRDPKLAALVSLKGGVSIVGTSWVLFPVLAMRVFQLPIRGLTTERAALLGMSLLMGARGVVRWWVHDWRHDSPVSRKSACGLVCCWASLSGVSDMLHWEIRKASGLPLRFWITDPAPTVRPKWWSEVNLSVI